MYFLVMCKKYKLHHLLFLSSIRSLIAEVNNIVCNGTLPVILWSEYITLVSLQRQLETLGAQRAGLEDMLKEMKRKVW